MQSIPQALAALTRYRQFIVWRLDPPAKPGGKPVKKPIDTRVGHTGDAQDSAVWLDHATACAIASAWGPQYGVGFVFAAADPFWFLDIDGALAGGQWSPLAHELLAMFPGAAVEVSVSGTGLHVIGSGTPPSHGMRNDALHLELYTERRFVALTGTHAQGDAASDHTAALAGLVARFFPPKAPVTPAEWSAGPCAGWNGPADDDALIGRALRSQSAAAAFGTRASFRDLWEGKIDALARAFPADPNSHEAYNLSSADAALAAHLSFWTGRDCERIERLMRRSALVRPKWDDRTDYYLRDRTILGAVKLGGDVLGDKELEPVAAPQAAVEAPRQRTVEGNTFLNPEDQARVFAGCVYVTDAHKVLVPGGFLLKPDQFRTRFGGYTMPLDGANERSTRNAWEAFTESQSLRPPSADASCFMPQHPPGALIADAGRVRVNVYWPVDVPRRVGDPGPFLRHLATVLPDERDRAILLAYMAACVQHQGIKFQWCPLLQGVEGNGKTLFTRCVAEAVGRRYCHWPRADQITEKFNAWLFGTVFIGVEDIYVPEHQREVLEVLKPMITGDNLSKRAMNTDQVTADSCANFMLNGNHKDAMRKTRNDRRIAPLFTAQQRESDLARDGLDGTYFQHLYDWLRAEGYAIVSELLHTMPIPDEFNPATGCQRAPTTSSTEAAIAAGMGAIEQEVQEAIEQQLPGFVGGWASSIMLDRLLDKLGASRRIPPNRRRELLQGLGYDWHPALPNGRVHNPVMPDGGKPRLFVRAGHEALKLMAGADVARAYSAAQSPVVSLAL